MQLKLFMNTRKKVKLKIPLQIIHHSKSPFCQNSQGAHHLCWGKLITFIKLHQRGPLSTSLKALKTQDALQVLRNLTIAQVNLNLGQKT